MPKLHLFKMTRNTTYFIKDQKVWEVFSTGALAYQCIGRFRGKGRWVMGSVHSWSENPNEVYLSKPDCDWKGEVEVSDEFYQSYRKIIGKIVKNEYWDSHKI